MLTPNHSTTIEVPHGTTNKVLQQGTSIKVPDGTLMDTYYTHGRKLQRGCAQIYLISIIYAIESSIMYIQNDLNIFNFRYCPEFCVSHAYYTSVPCVKSIQMVLTFFEKSWLIYLTCQWDVKIFPAEAVTSEEGNHQCQAVGRPYTNCSIDCLGGTHGKAKWSGL